MSPDAIDAAARVLVGSRAGMALTGAGISVASGVPDFRSAGGLWERFDPAEYANIDAFISRPDKVWEMFRAVDELLARAEPNASHRALAELERLGVLQGIVTQNIDGLHQLAGSRRVVEYHGSARQLQCVGCGATYGFGKARKAEPAAPRCRCGNPIKPTVVLFGEMIPFAAVAAAQELVRGADVLIVVGTSATVSPARELPLLAKEAGALLLEFNLESTSLTALADHVVLGPAEETLPQLLEAFHKLRA